MTSFEAFNRLKACRYGQMLYNIHDLYVGKSLDLYGEFSELEAELFKQLVRPGDTVVEVGANIGAHTLFFAQQVGPEGRVLAFEPQRVVFQTLCANLALSSITNVDCRREAVGAAPGETLVPWIDYCHDNNFGGLSLGEYQQGEPTTVVTIDSLGLRRANLIKIDVEGMELEALQGARETIARLKPVLYVENDREDKSSRLIRYIDSLGYRMYWHLPPLFNPKNFFANPENVFSTIVSINMVCVHRDVKQHMEGFKPVEVSMEGGGD